MRGLAIYPPPIMVMCSIVLLDLTVQSQMKLLAINICNASSVSGRSLRQRIRRASGGILQSYLCIRPKPRTM